MAILHMETDAVRALASQLKQVADDLRTQGQTLNSSALSVGWMGPSRDEFINETEGILRQLESQAESGIILGGRVENEVAEWEKSDQKGAYFYQSISSAVAGIGASLAVVGSSTWDLDKGWEFEKKNGALFKKGDGDGSDIQYDDIKQQQIGDCYLMASLAALAKNNPELIRQMIKDNGNGTYTVRFFEDGKPVFITVDSDVPVQKTLCFSKEKGGISSDDGELWPSIVEKAYAKWQGGYEKIGQGKPAAAGLDAITGIPATVIPVGGSQNIRDSVMQAYQSGDPIVVSTLQSPKNSDVIGNHGLMVQKIEGDTIYLYNPWGQDHFTINFNDLDGNIAEFTTTNMDATFDYSTWA